MGQARNARERELERRTLEELKRAVDQYLATPKKPIFYTMGDVTAEEIARLNRKNYYRLKVFNRRGT